MLLLFYYTDMMHYPKHVGFIPDGNRTWSKKQGHHESVGYLQGMHAGMQIVRHVLYNTPIQAITGWFMSTENIQERSGESIAQLLDLVQNFLNGLDEDLVATQSDFYRIGNPRGLPKDFVDFLEAKKKKFSFGGKRFVCFAINYGGQDEIVRAVQGALTDGYTADTLDTSVIQQYTDMGHLPPLELVIRTKGQYASRTSGFASRSIGYAELYFSNTLTPDFTPEEFDTILTWYDSIFEERNFGK